LTLPLFDGIFCLSFFFYFALIAVARLSWQPIWLVVLTDFIY